MAMSSTLVTRARSTLSPLVFLKSTVAKGFGRGSTQLGFPTANLKIRWDATHSRTTSETALEGGRASLTDDERNVLNFMESHDCGIYYGWCQVLAGEESGVSADIYPAAVSIGWNPTFDDVGLTCTPKEGMGLDKNKNVGRFCPSLYKSFCMEDW